MTTLMPSVALLQGSAETWHIHHSDFLHAVSGINCGKTAVEIKQEEMTKEKH